MSNLGMSAVPGVSASQSIESFLYHDKAFSQDNSIRNTYKKTLEIMQGSYTNEYQKQIRKINVRRKWHKPVRFAIERTRSIQDKTKKVLIVEDSQFNIMPIQRTLKRNKIPYDIANNGFMALDRYSKAMKDE
jgi:PleD family two-component response regulator